MKDLLDRLKRAFIEFFAQMSYSRCPDCGLLYERKKMFRASIDRKWRCYACSKVDFHVNTGDTAPAIEDRRTSADGCPVIDCWHWVQCGDNACTLCTAK